MSLPAPDFIVRELWRYPVKSLGGERLDALEVDARGVVGDRLWALVDAGGKLASGKDSRRFRKVPGLLMHAAALVDGRPVVNGREADEALARDLAGPGWTVRREAEVPHLDAAPVHVVTTATLRRLDLPAQRLRPNVLLEVEGDGFVEDAWVGRTLTIGAVVLRVVDRTERCVMVNHARPGIEARSTVLKAIGRANGACAGVYAEVLQGGRIESGAVARLM